MEFNVIHCKIIWKEKSDKNYSMKKVNIKIINLKWSVREKKWAKMILMRKLFSFYNFALLYICRWKLSFQGNYISENCISSLRRESLHESEMRTMQSCSVQSLIRVWPCTFWFRSWLLGVCAKKMKQKVSTQVSFQTSFSDGEVWKFKSQKNHVHR